MDAARQAVSKFTSSRGHRTDVDEVVNPAVTSETIRPHRHEETQEAIDREVHQHHYHTTVQPIAHEERLPERHAHNVLPTVEKTFRHDNEQETNRRVSAELAQFQNTSITEATRSTSAALPAVTGEHVHHHVHETVQPIIHKETYQPEVVHTTVPIHETHHVAAQHHGMSSLPMKSLSEFTSAGGILSGSQKHTHEEYEGAPRPYNEKLMTSIEQVLPHHSDSASGTTGTSGLGNRAEQRMESDVSGRRGLESGNGAGVGSGRTSDVGGRTAGTTGTTGTSGYDSVGNNSSSGAGYNSSSRSDRPDSGIGNNSSSSGGKPSLLDRLNPNKDTTGDGVAGFMK